MPGLFTTFTNCRLCIGGELVEGERLVVSTDEGKILESTGFIGGEIVDLDDAIIAPGFLELQTNGVNGFHFSTFEDNEQYALKLQEAASFYPSQGITGFWATIPTTTSERYQKILPLLAPKDHEAGASLLGAHAEGPYLNPSKPGAHNAELFQPIRTSLSSLYGQGFSNVKLMTLAPELTESELLIRSLVNSDVRVSLGHSAATYDQGLKALSEGATCLTKTMNCFPPLHHREPGLAGLITVNESTGTIAPYYSLIADGHHVHPSVVTMLYRAAPKRCILASDSIELAGRPDGTYPGNSLVTQNQVKAGPIATIEGTNTLIGSCTTVNESVKNLIKWSGCSVAEAVRCVTENVVDMMGVLDRGILQEGRRADFVVLDDEGNVLETWIKGRQVWRAEGREPWY
ncbi:N-acetylglucosamine-6-phosphate deacetylase [Verruconis gallopava]|uniref:N-acetylglucosamine-6-phosphate deacetylase n=1 Tax=Verruconis gallopava TaxID=253628 RepID=A0A0D2AI34_9PEZI|nr:N-acetylglucosamine-6-phosphate deacetylase [Verruconis gallopava]KIW06508.1 N-acetylglucosamine-6-phosphate deacetylase [Verruconis gallopava]